jgi:hypothetical protein
LRFIAIARAPRLPKSLARFDGSGLASQDRRDGTRGDGQGAARGREAIDRRQRRRQSIRQRVRHCASSNARMRLVPGVRYVPVLAHPDDRDEMSEFVTPMTLLGGSCGGHYRRAGPS